MIEIDKSDIEKEYEEYSDTYKMIYTNKYILNDTESKLADNKINKNREIYGYENSFCVMYITWNEKKTYKIKIKVVKTIEINDNTNIIFFEYVNGENDNNAIKLLNQASNPYSKYDIIINTDCEILNKKLEEKLEEKLKLEIIDLTSEEIELELKLEKIKEEKDIIEETIETTDIIKNKDIEKYIIDNYKLSIYNFYQQELDKRSSFDEASKSILNIDKMTYEITYENFKVNRNLHILHIHDIITGIKKIIEDKKLVTDTELEINIDFIIETYNIEGEDYDKQEIIKEQYEYLINKFDKIVILSCKTKSKSNCT